MTKYTRREFFKSIIPAGVGTTLFLGSNNSDKSPKLDLLIDDVMVSININGNDYITTRNWAGDVLKQKWPEFISMAIQNHLDLDGWHIVDNETIYSR